MGGLGNLATLGLNLALQETARRRSASRLASEERARRRELVARFAEQQRRSEELLRERLARARARAGAAGVASGASFDAILRGLEREADEQQRLDSAAFAAGLEALRTRMARARERNLLESADRLAGLGRSGLRGLSGWRRDLLE